jgi:glucose-6-phosphate dehydrogenase assembly protein OpcA
VANDLMPGVSDSRWAAEGTTPGAIEAALRKMFAQRHKEERAYVPARVMNMVVIVDKDFRGEVENRLQRVGRYHPSRLIVVAVEPGRQRLSAVARIGTDDDARSGAISVGRERVELLIGERHLPKLDTIVDPLVISDLATMVWAPHGHREAVDALRRLAQIILIDSQDEPDVADALDRAADLADAAYLVDLAWLRSTPWRERVAAAFDPPSRRHDLETISEIHVRHHPDSTVAGLLLLGWLTTRLGWEPTRLMKRGDDYVGKLHGRRQDVQVRLEPTPMPVRGLAGVTIDTAAGESLSLDRGDGGLQAVRRNRKGALHAWTILGASRGEAGILGEGIRQALLRDPTYRPALTAANALVHG